jgi:hypothetical protein
VATFYSGSNRGYQLRLELWESSTNAAANTSTVRSQLFLTNTSNTFSFTSNGNHSISGNAVWAIRNQRIDLLNRYSSVYLSDSTITHGHDANGSGGASAFADFQNTSLGWPYNCPYLAVSGSIGLTDFNRSPSQPSSVTATLTSGNNISVTAAAANSPAGTPTYFVSYSSSFGASWSSESVMNSSRTFLYSTLTKGNTYIFRVRVSNSDGFSGFTSSATIFLPSGGKRFDGNRFIPATTAKRFNVSNSSWIDISTAKRYNSVTGLWDNLS